MFTEVDNGPGWFDVLGTIGVLAATVVAAWAALATQKSARAARTSADETKRLVGLEGERRAEEREQAGSADVRGHLEPTAVHYADGSRQIAMVITNHGPAIAEEFRLVVPVLQSLIWTGDHDVDMVPGVLYANQTVRLTFRLSHHDEPPTSTIGWTDVRGERTSSILSYLVP